MGIVIIIGLFGRFGFEVIGLRVKFWRAIKVEVLNGFQKGFITLLQAVLAGPVFSRGGKDDLVVIERLDSVFQHWSVGFTENVGADSYCNLVIFHDCRLVQ